MVCLATNYMLIADIDCGANIDRPLGDLVRWVNRHGGSFRVYKTKNGMRYLQTHILYQGINQSAFATLVALGSDPSYINFSRLGGRFMARLSPKLSPLEIERYFQRAHEPPEIAVCHFLATVGQDKICSPLRESIALHDFQSRSLRSDLPLA